MLLRLARHLNTSKIPLHETIGHFLSGQGGLNSDMFRNDVLAAIMARNELTDNMIAVLEMRYNPRNDRYFFADRLLVDLEERASEERLIIFQSQRDIDAYLLKQTQQTEFAASKITKMRRTVQPQEEPLYIIRSIRNTYWNPD